MRLPAHRDHQGPDHHRGRQDHHLGRQAGGRSHLDVGHRAAGHRHHRDGDHRGHLDAGRLDAAHSQHRPDAHREPTDGQSRAAAGSDGRWPTSDARPAGAGWVARSATQGGPAHRVRPAPRARHQGEAAERWAHRDERRQAVRTDAQRAVGQPDAGPWAAADGRRQVLGDWCRPESAGC